MSIFKQTFHKYPPSILTCSCIYLLNGYCVDEEVGELHYPYEKIENCISDMKLSMKYVYENKEILNMFPDIDPAINV